MKAIQTIFAALLLACIVHAEEEETKPKVEFYTGGFAYYQTGQIIRQKVDRSRAWEQYLTGRLRLGATVNELVTVRAAIEAWKYFNNFDSQKMNGITLKEAQGIIGFGDIEHMRFELATGYFAFKYNAEAMHLGEYMFRTGCYPSYIINSFDFAAARLAGLRATLMHISGILRHDIILNSEIDFRPYEDFSLSYLLNANLFDIAGLGAGFSMYRIIPIDKALTNPKDAYVVDENFEYVIKNGDTLRYTHQGQKLMGRIAFDPKPIFDPVIFGREDLKLYAELAMLGLKNYGPVYNDLAKRMPIMFGFHIPTFNIMDVLAFEMEIFTSDYTNDPGTTDPSSVATEEEWKTKDNVKWAVYARKTFLNCLSIKGLIGSDHYRDKDEGGGFKAVEPLGAPDHWHYIVRLQYSF